MSGELSSLIKPLVWLKPMSADTLTRADTPFGFYRVWTHFEAEGRWFWSLTEASSFGNLVAKGEGASEDEARDGATADYQQRAALVLDPAELTRLRSENAELAADAIETLQRLVELTPVAANARDARSLHLTVKVIAECALERIEALSRVSGGGK